MQNNINYSKINLSENIINPANPIPIIAIDGPTASGKGTIARKLSEHFGYHYLNSGSLYRLTAYIAKENGVKKEDFTNLAKIGASLSPIFYGEQVIVNGKDLWPILKREEVGSLAAEISPTPELRQAIYDFQRSQIKIPGLVAEGRDMAGGVFGDAQVKIYLDASAEAQTERRLKEEQEKDPSVTYDMLLLKMQKRNAADKSIDKKFGVLKIMPEALYIDTSNMTREEVFEKAKKYCEELLKIN
jgi:cytidylate kinase